MYSVTSCLDNILTALVSINFVSPIITWRIYIIFIRLDTILYFLIFMKEFIYYSRFYIFSINFYI